MPLTKITSSEISTGAVTADKIANNVTLGGPKITTVNVANSAYTVLDDTAVNIGGGYIVITGSGFESGAQVIIDTTTATSVAYVNNTTLRAEVPSKSAASYNLYVVNPDGGTAIRVNGLTYSANPTWVTASPLDNWSVDVAANVAFSATGATSYSNTTALPAGTQLLSNGYFYGTVTGISVETQYTFTVRATDAENQESDKSFSVTVTVGPPAGQLWSWGRNDSGQLGHNDTTYRSSPVQVGTSTNWVQGAARLQAAIIKNDGTLWSWGNNNVGRLGLNDTIYRSSPVQVGSSTNWSKTFLGGAGLSGFFAIKTDNTLWAWGNNLGGRLGLNDTIYKSSPTQVGTATWSHISANDYSVIGVRYNGTLWAWGNNGYGQLGLNNTNAGSSSPIQVGTNTNWSKAILGGRSNAEGTAFGLKTDGTLWAWGYNYSGVLGLNTSTGNYKSSPTQIGTDTNWAFIPGRGSNYRSMLAIKSNGTLWSWGNNTYGQLGLNDTSYKSSPTQVGSDTTWSSVELVGSSSTAAIKTNDTLWIWGQNHRGQLGLNDTQSKSSPTQVGTTGWKTIMTSADYITMAIKQ